MISKLKSLGWFLTRPQHFKTFFYLLGRKFLPDKEGTKAASTEWCEERALKNMEALKHFYPTVSLEKVEDIHPDKFSFAKKAAQKCTLPMGSAGDLNLLYHLTVLSGAKKVVETGVAFGWSSLAILLALSETEEGKLISGDLPYLNMNNEPFVGCVVHESLKSKWELIRQADRQALPQALKEFKEIDLCHYDSDKSYYGRMWAYPKLWSALKEGGFFVSDDINDNMAFIEFSEQVKKDPTVVEFDGRFVGILQK